MAIRKLAVDILIDLIKNHKSLSVLSSEIRRLPNKHDRAYVQELVYGMARWYWRVNGVLYQLLRKPLKDSDQDIHILILIGLYELMYMRTPSHAVVSNIVETTRALGKPKATGFVNAILRSFLRDKIKYIKKSDKNPVSYFSHPKWLIEKIKKSWPRFFENILKANNQHPPMTLRVNEQRLPQEDYLRKLSAVGIAAKPSGFSRVGIELETPVSIKDLPGFAAGEVYVQDIAAQLAAPLLQLKPGQVVLDACAAPGGKTCHILESQPDLKELIAIDSSKKRMQLLKDNLMRVQLKASTICADILDLNTWWNKQPFDRILLDAPCTSTGVIRRHPDIKLLRRPTDIEKTSKKQYQILKTLWQTLKPGGLLVYVTCSIFPDENVNIITKFVEEKKDVQEIKIEANWGHVLTYGRQILTGEHNLDGFYYAILKKQK